MSKKVALIYPVIEPIDVTACTALAKPYLALQNSGARGADCGLLYRSLEPINQKQPKDTLMKKSEKSLVRSTK